MLKNIQNWQMLDFFIPSRQVKEVLCCGNVRTRAVYAMDSDCSLSSGQLTTHVNVTCCYKAHQNICSIESYFLSICIHRRAKTFEKSYWPRRDVKSSERNRHLNDHNLKEEYSVFEEANTLYCQRVYIDAEVQTNIMASDFLMPVWLFVTQ